MARDKLTVDLELNAAKARREVARLQKEIDKMGKGLSKSFGGGMGGGGDKVRALGTGLSKATVRADEFNKSLEASNARVIAFGASAGLIMAVDRALKAMVSSALKVEKAMTDVNVVMNASVKTLDQFGKGMFKVARETAQSFDTVAEAATELARQGLGMEKTLARTKDALILTRLTGMNAADSVKTLTAAVNSFNKEGVTSAQVINRMAKVDAAFAVSSEDLAKSISRVGSSAIDAGVNLNQLMAITTAVQQKTARGGAVIGNAFKTIFTRIQRTDVQKKLRDIGVALTKDGKLLDGVTILQNLSRSFGDLSKAQQASVGESVAGVFQINILKAAMSDLVNVNSEYAKSLRIANAATNEAYVRNEQLNQTLDALVNKTLANLTQAGAALGGGTLEPAIRKILGTVNSAIESFGEGGSMEGVGETVGKGLLAGIGNFISGPGIILVTAAFAKLALNLGKFATTAMKDFMGLANASKQRVALEEAVIRLIQSEPTYLTAVKRGTLDILNVERDIFEQIELNNLERTKAATYASTITAGLIAKGTTVGSKGGVTVKGRPGGAGGFVPNFADAGSERAAAAAGGYSAGAIKTMRQPGAGTVMYNSAETVKRFPGMSQSAIMPPQGSAAGAGYKSAFGAAHGFDPYAGSGFVPNFGVTKSQKRKGRQKAVKGDVTLKASNDMGVLLAEAGSTSPLRFTNNLSEIPKLVEAMRTSTTYKHLYAGNKEGRFLSNDTKIRVKGMPVVSMFPMSDAEASGHAEGQDRSTITILQNSLNRYKNQVASKLWGLEGGGSLGDDFNVKRLSKGTSGDIFEEAVRASLMDGDINRNASFDYSGERYAPKQLIKYMRAEGAKKLVLGRSKIEAKIGKEAAVDGNIPKKVFNDSVGVGDKLALTKNKILKEIQTQTGLKAALGFVPNFSPLTSAIGREMQAGVPASAIRVGSSSALKAAGNPGGVGVYNTMHEPGGLGQGISRSRASGINPKSHGAASGFVPNFETFAKGSHGYGGNIYRMNNPDESIKASREQAKAAKSNVASGKKFKVGADKIMMASMVLNMAASGMAAGMGVGQKTQAGIGAGANILSMGAMGASMGTSGGPWGIAAGAVIGGGLGALTSMGDIGTALGFKDAEIAAEEMKKVGVELKEAFIGIKESMNTLKDFDMQTPTERIKALAKLVALVEGIEKGETGNADSTVRHIRGSVREEVGLDAVVKSGGKNLKAADFTAREEQINNIETQLRSTIAGGDFRDLMGATAPGQEVASRNIGEQGRSQEKIRKFQKNRFLPELQAQLLEVEGAPQAIADIRDAVRDVGYTPGGNIRSVGRDQSTGRAQLNRQQKLIQQAQKLAKVMQQGGMEPQSKELLEQIAAANAGNIDKDVIMAAGAPQNAGLRGKGLRTKMFEQGPAYRAGRSLSMYMNQLFTEQEGELGGLHHPLRMAEETKLPPDINAGSVLNKGDVSARIRAAQEGLTTAGLDSRYGALSRTGARKRHFAGRAVDRVSAGRMAGITMAGDTLIGEQGRLQKEGAGDKARQAKQLLALKQRDKFIQAEIKLRSTLAGSIEGITMSYDAQAALLKKFEKDYADASKTDIESRLKTLDAKQKRDDDLNSAEIAEVKYLESLRKLREADMRETSHGIAEINKSRKSEKDNIDKSTAARISERKAMLEFQRAIRVQAITDAEVKTRNEAAGLRGLKGEGYGITSREIADADKNARRARIRAGGAGDSGAAFREAFAYGDTDALLEFEDGVVDVANTMKSSFASAFQSISSGATTVGGAIAGMAQNILNSISQASSQMFTNMLFSRMGGQFSQGGLVPGYASGGVVTGGSGNKDDVLTKMQGGEFVIKKSSAQQIGYGTLNAINSYAGGGGVPQDNSAASMGKMGAIAAGAGAVSGMIGAAMQDKPPEPLPMQDYGMGRGKYGFFGGADPDAGQVDSVSGGRGRAQVSLGKSFSYYRRDPDSGELISERARPTEGRFEVSSRLSLLGRLGDDPQTSRMFGKEQKMASYQQYLADETKSRADQIQAVEDQKKARRIQAGVNAVMMIGGAYAMDKMQAAKMAKMSKTNATGMPDWATGDEMINYGDTSHFGQHAGAIETGANIGSAHAASSMYQPNQSTYQSSPSQDFHIGGRGTQTSWDRNQYQGVMQSKTNDLLNFSSRFPPPTTDTAISIGGGPGGANGGLARVMGGEYVMSPEAVRTYGADFMTELNRGKVPGFANGGPVGGATVGGGGGMGNTNNVRINVNIDRRGAPEVSADSKTEDPTAKGQQAEDNNEVLNNKEFAGVLEGVVLEQIIKQQRPGGLLSPHTP